MSSKQGDSDKCRPRQIPRIYLVRWQRQQQCRIYPEAGKARGSEEELAKALQKQREAKALQKQRERADL
jgi:hypothetical protein